MASHTSLDKQVISVLKYDVSRPYFGDFKFSDLYDAQALMRRNEYYDLNGSRNMRVYVGKINGDVICDALWRLMQYNPVRFSANPFLYNGKNNIYKFVTDTALPADSVTANVISGVRGNLREYLFANAGPNGRWRDEIETTDGFVYTVLNEGRTEPMYKKLCLLRNAIKIITKQNCADYNAKSGPYRDEIRRVTQQLHPGIYCDATSALETDDIAIEDKIYEQMDALQITLDNQSNVSPEQYEQARCDMAYLISKLNGRAL